MSSVRGLLTTLCLLACSVAVATEHTKDSLDKVKQRLAKGEAILLDVRETKEWEQGHLQDARLLSLSQLKTVAKDAAAKEKLLHDLPKDKIVYCHCARGVRALSAGGILEKLGYDVRPLEAGYDALREAGFPEAKK